MIDESTRRIVMSYGAALVVLILLSSASAIPLLSPQKALAFDDEGNIKFIVSKVNGYFHTDSDGNVNDQTAIKDVEKGHHKINFGYDTNYDGMLDSEIGHSEITIPCQNM